MAGNGPQPTTPDWASDEMMAIQAGGDFITLCPAWQTWARGTDGVFNAGDPWTLNSASMNFVKQGVTPQSVCVLSGAGLQSSGEMFAVDTVATTSVGLRRIAMQPGQGQPPAPTTGSSGVQFNFPTHSAMLNQMAFRLKDDYAIDEAIFFRSSPWLYAGVEDPYRVFRDAVVFGVLRDLYEREARNGDGDFERKAHTTSGRYKEATARILARWGPYGNSAQPASKFNTRLSR